MVINRGLRRVPICKANLNVFGSQSSTRTLPAVTCNGQPFEFRRSIHSGTQDNEKDQRDWTQLLKWLGAAGGIGLAWSLTKEKLNESASCAAAATARKSPNAIEHRVPNNLPIYSASEVAEHYDEKSGVWVTFKDGVYDITDFISKHPGGSRIMMAAGGSLEPFWELYPQHQKDEVFQLLEKYRIGNLTPEDIFKSDSTSSSSDYYRNDPKRHVALISRSLKPCNAETPPVLLTEKFNTPNDLFYVRNHLPVPVVDLKEYQLDVGGLNMKSKSFTLEQIKKLTKVKVSSAIQCAGNRRADMNEYKKTIGLEWTGGAIGNAEWAGARLRDVLKLSGFNIEKFQSPEKLHIVFEGLDSDPSGESYGASIPLHYLLDNNFEPVVAYEMNGEPLPRDHGFPLRVILPGLVGARNVKWLARIEISDKESDSPWQKRDYKVFSPSTTLETVDYSSAPPIMDTPINSFICSHEDGTTVARGAHKFQGYAHSGGGRQVVRVEVSTDKGNTWKVVDSLRTEKPQGAKYYSWALWETNLSFPNPGEHEVWVKAVDSSYNQQPEGFSGIWNYRGLIANAYHKVKVNVQ